MQPDCSVCQQKAHDKPKQFLRLFNLTCPGEKASDEDKKAFTDELDWRKNVASRFGQETAADPELTDSLLKRRVAALERFEHPPTREVPNEAVVSADQVPSVDAITGMMTGKQEIADVLAEPAEFEIEVPHLTVPGEVPEQKTPLVQPHAASGTKHQSSDYLLYLGEKQE